MVLSITESSRHFFLLADNFVFKLLFVPFGRPRQRRAAGRTTRVISDAAVRTAPDTAVVADVAWVDVDAADGTAVAEAEIVEPESADGTIVGSSDAGSEGCCIILNVLLFSSCTKQRKYKLFVSKETVDLDSMWPVWHFLKHTHLKT